MVARSVFFLASMSLSSRYRSAFRQIGACIVVCGNLSYMRLLPHMIDDC